MKYLILCLGIITLLSGCTSTFENHSPEYSTDQIRLSTELKDLTIKESPQGIHTIHIGTLLQYYFNGEGDSPGTLELIDCEIHTHIPLIGQAIQSCHLTTKLTFGEKEYFISVIGDKIAERTGTGISLANSYEADAIDAARKTYFQAMNLLNIGAINQLAERETN